MKFKLAIILMMLFTVKCMIAEAQIEKVVVETYYISGNDDATDTTGGYLAPGSVTYRIYVDLEPGMKVKSIYGDVNHALKISSTAAFFNNLSEGQTFAKDMAKSRLSENTVALDSWLTIGLVTKPASKVVGVLKTEDDDGSFIGGVNNDGGSAAVANGLLTNNDILAGIPLTTSDGNDTLSIPAGSWFDYGIKSNTEDSTIFGSLVQLNSFECDSCLLVYTGGVSGVNADSNCVLLAQLTTTGEIAFELNLEIMDSMGTTFKFVANDSILLMDEILNRYLKFPYVPVCGCPDQDYLEYMGDRDCNSLDSCKNLIVFGCMDEMACNFNPQANVNIASLCCYPGRCSDRDLDFVCPETTTERKFAFEMFPNPVSNLLQVSLSESDNTATYYLYNSLGSKIAEGIIETGISSFQVDATSLSKGIYFLRVEYGSEFKIETFIKD